MWEGRKRGREERGKKAKEMADKRVNRVYRCGREGREEDEAKKKELGGKEEVGGGRGDREEVGGGRGDWEERGEMLGRCVREGRGGSQEERGAKIMKRKESRKTWEGRKRVIAERGMWACRKKVGRKEL